MEVAIQIKLIVICHLDGVQFCPCFVWSCSTNIFSYSSVYEAGKAVKKGIPGHYAPTLYAPSMYAQPAYSGVNQPSFPLLPLPNGAGPPPPQNGYGREYDRVSSGECTVGH